MARTAITPVAVTRAGVTLTLGNVDAATAPNGMSFATDGSEILVIKNADAASHTCTVAVNPKAVPDGLTAPTRVITIAAAATKYCGEFGPEYRQDDGTVHLNFDSATSMTVGVLNVD